jgi:hypothetical protein
VTAEVAVMNREAVALAADSAVTIADGNSTPKKILSSGNKVFALSKRFPVGVIWYNRADLMGVPWETVLKHFRERYMDDEASTLREYADRFVKFIQGFPDELASLDEELAKESLRHTRAGVHQDIKVIADEEMDWIGKDVWGRVDPSDIVDVIRDQVRFRDLLRISVGERVKMHQAVSPGVENIVTDFLNVQGEYLQRLCWTVFQMAVDDDELTMSLKTTVAYAVLDRYPAHSGVAIAGFGRDDLFPSLCAYQVYITLTRGVPNIVEIDNESCRVSLDEPAKVVPFAQPDVMRTFMEGIDPSLRRRLQDMSTGLVGPALKLYRNIIRGLVEESNTIGPLLDRALDEVMEEVGNSNADEIGEEINRAHLEPFLRAVGFLGKDQLASLAETLIEMTAVRRLVSDDWQTVGGAVDVALISKGDGLVWIKRKHYFDAGLNHHFFRNYYE